MISAAVLAPLALFCVWLGGWLYLVLMLAAFAGVVWEWGTMCRWRPVPLVLGVLYAALAILALLLLRDRGGALFVYFVLGVVWCSDIGAYAVGRIAGGPRLAPRVSPGKTWSGAAGGLVAAIVAGAAVGSMAHAALWGAAVAIVLGIASQLGDLGESALKRLYDVKDSGRLLPGHGGLLDRLDGLMAAAIVAGAGLATAIAAPGLHP